MSVAPGLASRLAPRLASGLASTDANSRTISAVNPIYCRYGVDRWKADGYNELKNGSKLKLLPKSCWEGGALWML